MIWSFILGFIIGANAGVFLLAIIQVNKSNDEQWWKEKIVLVLPIKKKWFEMIANGEWR